MAAGKGDMRLLWEALKEWVRDRAKGMAPALAYYELLSAAPLIGFLLFISGKVFGLNVLLEDVIPLLKSTFTPQMVSVITFLLAYHEDMEPGELYTLSFLSALLLVWATKEYFGQVKQTIENTWNKRRDRFGFKWLLKRTLTDVKIALGAVLIMMVFLFIRTLLPHPFITQIGSGADDHLFLVHLVQWVTRFLLLVSLYIFYFTYIPPVKVNWKNTVPGAMLGALLFIIGREIMMAHFRERPGADVAESLVMVLLWLYYANLVFVYAAEFSKLYISRKQDVDWQNLKSDEGDS